MSWSIRGSGTTSGFDLKIAYQIPNYQRSSYWSFCFLALSDRTKVFTKN